MRLLRERLVAQILASRQVTKRVALQRLQAELSAVDGTAVAPAGLPLIARPNEVRRANAIARRLIQMRADGLDERLVGNALFEKIDPRLVTIARTEPANALNAERSIAMRSEPAYRNWAKRWDATGDRRMCPVCERADGTIVMVNDSFPAGQPGAVHANCRCMETYLAPFEFSAFDLAA